MWILRRLANGLESRWVTPAYSGWLLLGLALFFFGAATNTLSGWLYVLSGVILALLLMGAILSIRTLRSLQIERLPISPVSAGDTLTLELLLKNPTPQPKALVQVQDALPYVWGAPVQTVIESIPAHGEHHWVYAHATEKRGVYRWHTVQLRTAAPFGLFWCRRSWEVNAVAIVYPQVLPLSHCPLVDEIGQDASPNFFSRDRRSQAATEGLTRSLRPYRWGDSTRLIHWRTSARYGELQVRELEVFTGGQELIICLDSASGWQVEAFEQAVIAAASLYFYACRCGLNVKLWTAGTGLLKGDLPVLEALAAVNAEEAQVGSPPHIPLVWLSQIPTTLNTLPPGSRWLLWHSTRASADPPELINCNYPGLTIHLEQSLQMQLQSSIPI